MAVLTWARRTLLAGLLGAVSGILASGAWPASCRVAGFVEPSQLNLQPAIPVDLFLRTANGLAYAARLAQRLRTHESAWQLGRRFSVSTAGSVLVLNVTAADRQVALETLAALRALVTEDFRAAYEVGVAPQRAFESDLLRRLERTERDVARIANAVDESISTGVPAETIVKLLARLEERNRAALQMSKELRELRAALASSWHDVRSGGPDIERTTTLAERRLRFASVGAALGALVLGAIALVGAYLRAYRRDGSRVEVRSRDEGARSFS